MTDFLDRIGRIVLPGAYLIEQPEGVRERAREVARKALEAILEPTPDMIAAGQDEIEESPDLPNAERIWRRMVEAALGD